MKGFGGDASNEWQTQGDVPRCGQGKGGVRRNGLHPALWALVVAISLAPRNSASLQVDPSWPEVLGAGRGMSHGGGRWYPQSMEARAHLPAVTVGTATARPGLMFTTLRQ